MAFQRRVKDNTGKQDNLENLLVFGYQCKLFRDDERAMFIDSGQHLIPWMGDESIMIDRYDGRGHLYDLRSYDSELLDTSGSALTEKERALEKACDEERYLELNTDILNKQMYEEEEMKRLYEAVGEDGGYAAVAFNYDQSKQVQPTDTKIDEEEDEPYELIVELQVPKGVNLPPTMKMHAIIEKTAAFIASQGTQMEIVIAAKQKNNPQFGFLNFGHELNVYYKHIVRQIQKGKYKAKPQETYNKRRQRKTSEGGDASEHGYLHPSLGGKQQIEEVHPEKFLESVTTKLPTGQIANTAYAKLLSNLSKHTGRDSPQPQPQPAPKEPLQPQGANVEITVAEKDKMQPPPKPPFIETEKAPVNQPAAVVENSDPVTVPGPNQPPPPGTEPVAPPQGNGQHVEGAHESGGYPAAGYDYAHGGGGAYPYPPHHHHPQHNHYPHHYPPPPHHYSDPHYAAYYAAHYEGGYANSAPTQDPNVAGAAAAAGVSYPGHNHGAGGESQVADTTEEKVVMGPQPQPKPSVPKPEAVAEEEDEDSDEELAACPEHITIPPREVRPIIDKMAVYVHRNGGDFQLMMRKKNDERFRFLNTWHPHYSYYEWRLQNLRKEAEEKEAESSASKSVSFSIRAKESDPATVTSRTPAVSRALLGDDSEEDEQTGGSDRMADPSRSNTPLVQVDAQQSQSTSSTPDPKKQAEEMLKNKLAVAARDKLAYVKEEGKLKAERKKKAAMFAALLSKNPGEAGSETMSRISSMASIASFTGGGDARSGTESPMPRDDPAVDDNDTASSRHSTPRPSRCDGDVSIAAAVSPAPPAAGATAPPVTQQTGSRRRRAASSSSSSSSGASPSPVKSKSKSQRRRSRSRSKSRRSKTSRRKRSRSRSKRSRSRSKGARSSRSKRSDSRSRRSRSRSKHKKKPPALPSAYTVMRRSSSPKSASKRRKSRSNSPSSRQKRSKPRRSSSRSRKSRSKSPRRKRRSRSRSGSKSRSKSKKSKSKKSKNSHKRSPGRKKGKMVPIPELSPPPTAQIIVSSENSDAEAAQNGVQAEKIGTFSNSSSPSHTSEGEIKSPKPSEDLISKVRAMLQAQKEIMQDDG